MKIVHIAPNAPYNEGWSYQENLLPKYQLKLGHDVVLIITNETHSDGGIIETSCSEFFSSDGFSVIRRKKKYPYNPLTKRMISYIDVYDLLCRENPDLVFYHGLISLTINQVVKYKKRINPNLVIVQDNHMDNNIGIIPNNFPKKLKRTLYRYVYRKNDKYINKVYGVTPWRAEYAIEFFKVPKNKIDILIMGADDEKILFRDKDKIKTKIRERYKISRDDFLIVTGGKIDKNKNIHTLMSAVLGMDNVKLIVFGNVDNDFKKEFYMNLNSNVIYIGWIKSEEAYDYFLASDLAFFPGQHSVLWEQACASKIPCVFKYWPGMFHVNNGGNSSFINEISTSMVRNKILELKFTDEYYKMKSVSESAATDIFCYSSIAKKSLECVNG